MSRSFDISISSVWDTKSQTHTQMPMSLRYRLLMLMMFDVSVGERGHGAWINGTHS